MKTSIKRILAVLLSAILVLSLSSTAFFASAVVGDYTGGEEKIYTLGDINGDLKVNNKDITRLFQYLSDWDVEVNEPALDVNGDSQKNNKDLTRLFQYLSGWNVDIH